MARTANRKRETTETKVALAVDLDGGPYRVATTIPFFDHMLSLMAKHGGIGLAIDASGDTDIDLHHTVEDVGITLGEALREALGPREGIRRYGQAAVPMDEALATANVDLCTRPYFVYNVPRLPGAADFDTDLAEQFFRALVTGMQATVHLALAYGSNQHHAIEALFKALGRALGEAATPDPRIRGALSTKGCL
ncbi:MAG: imidazoleglycerol-phosphate dehydratase HisB [Acidobacteria bacterium]|nr:imidazoleglycerol-phosphate dehydratase HisB [Acidobacteriota bacterium]